MASSLFSCALPLIKQIIVHPLSKPLPCLPLMHTYLRRNSYPLILRQIRGKCLTALMLFSSKQIGRHPSRSHLIPRLETPRRWDHSWEPHFFNPSTAKTSKFIGTGPPSPNTCVAPERGLHPNKSLRHASPTQFALKRGLCCRACGNYFKMGKAR
jgi:hypothetical protein